MVQGRVLQAPNHKSAPSLFSAPSHLRATGAFRDTETTFSDPASEFLSKNRSFTVGQGQKRPVHGQIQAAGFYLAVSMCQKAPVYMLARGGCWSQGSGARFCLPLSCDQDAATAN